MFLIERLPKESEKIHRQRTDDKVSALEAEIAHNLRAQLNAAWTPQYCKKQGIVQYGSALAVQAGLHPFSPHKLNIPHPTAANNPPELREYWTKRSPTIFQQTKSNNLCATLIHKNDIDRFGGGADLRSTKNFNKLLSVQKIGPMPRRTLPLKATAAAAVTATAGTPVPAARTKENIRNIKSVQQLTLNNIEIPNQNDIVQMPEISEVDALNFDVEKLKESIEQCVMNRKTLMSRINDVKEAKATEERSLAKLRDNKRIKERTHILLENPEVNVAKMGAVLAATRQRMNQLAAQWDEHRLPLQQQLEQAGRSTTEQSVRFTKNY